MRRVGLAVLLVALAGCATTREVWHVAVPADSASTMLARADRFAGDGQYEQARDVYDEVMAKYPAAAAAVQARSRRAVTVEILTARDELVRLRHELSERDAELTKLRTALADRDADVRRLLEEVNRRQLELMRVRQELVKRQEELVKRQEELVKRQEELEQLKRIDLELDRKKR